MEERILSARQQRLGKTQQKIILLLWAGLALGLSPSPMRQVRIVRGLVGEWRKVNRCTLTRSVDSLYRSKLVKKKMHRDGTLTLVLTEAGKKKALRYNIDSLHIKRPKHWDGKWRVVIYDVPEAMRDLRVELFLKLRHLGFYELQQSVFVHPHECRDEIEYLIEAYDARRYVRRLLVEEIDSPGPLLTHFNLLNRRYTFANGR